jgi:protein O-mannosyl-transferase
MSPSQPTASFTLQDQKCTVVAVCVLLVAGVFLAFSQTLSFGFVNYDDDDYFSSNYHVKAGLTWAGIKWAFRTGYANNWHPLTWLSLMLDVQLFGAGPVGPHFTNVLLHAINAVLLFLLFRRLTGALWPSAVVAALFAVHPLRVESVAWVAERKDVLSGFFFLLTLGAYALYVEKSRIQDSRSKVFYAVCLLAFVCGLMSKPMLVTLPFVLLLLDYWPLNRFSASTFKQLLVEKTPFLVLSGVSCVVTIIAQQQVIRTLNMVPPELRLSNAVNSYVIYLIQMFWPIDLAAFYPSQVDVSLWQILGAGVMLLIMTLLAILTARRFPYFPTGWLWYLGMLVPVIGLIQVGNQSHADRYSYLPQIGLYIAIVWTIKDLMISWRYRHQILVPLASVIICILMVRTRKQASYWSNDIVLMEHAIASTSGNYVAHNNLGYDLAHEGRTAEAFAHYQQALKYYPDFAEANCNLGVLYSKMGKLDEAARYFRRVIQLNPNLATAYNNLGNVLVRQGRMDEAVEQYQKVLELNPDRSGITVEIHNNLGSLFAKQGRTDEAIEQYQKALEIEPDNAEIQINLANILAAQGRVDEAIEQYQQGLKQMPDSVHAHYQMAFLLQSRGEFAASVVEFQKVLQLDPKHGSALNNLAWLLATCPDNSVRNGTKAVDVAEQAVKLSGGEAPEILDTLAAAYAEAGRFPEAVATANRALNLAVLINNKPLAEAIKAQLKFYEAGSPFRDVSSTTSH